MSIDWEQERLRRQARDDAFMADLRAEHRHEFRVTVVGGIVGFMLVLLVVAGAFAIWGDTVPFDISMGLNLLAIALVFGGVVLAHTVDDRRSR